MKHATFIIYRKASAVIAALLMVMAPHAVWAQTTQHTFSGKAKVKDGPGYPYKFTFTLKGSHIQGYSITTQPDGLDLKTKISGRLDKKNHIIAFKELKPEQKLQEDDVPCLFDVVLTYKLRNDKYYINGIFTGKDENNELCSAGTLEFEQPDKLGFVLRDSEPQIQKKIAQPADTIHAECKITAGNDQQIDWHSKTCKLAIWDGGVTDGDVVTIMLNGVQLLGNYTLTADKKTIELPLTGNKNTITIVAEDEGTTMLTTAKILLTDGEAQHNITFYNSKGKTADIILLRK